MTDKRSIEVRLLDQISNGNESAFIEVYEKYWQYLFNSGYKRLKSREVVEGMVQEVFVDLWQKRKILNINHSLESYLYTMMKYKVFNHVKSLILKDKYNNFIANQPQSFGSEVEEKLMFEELEKAFGEVVEKLPPQAKKVYQMRHISGLKYAEIATKLEISVSTVEKHMIKAIKILRTNLKDYSN